MTFSEFKTDVCSKSVNRENLDNISFLENRVYSALMYIARKTVPTYLVFDGEISEPIFRRVTNDYVLKYPNKPSSDTDVITIDNTLLDAAAYHVLAGIETARAPQYMKMCNDIIDEYDRNLIQDDISTFNVVPADFEGGDYLNVIYTED
jgi:hypothetical protein